MLLEADNNPLRLIQSIHCTQYTQRVLQLLRRTAWKMPIAGEALMQCKFAAPNLVILSIVPLRKWLINGRRRQRQQRRRTESLIMVMT